MINNVRERNPMPEQPIEVRCDNFNEVALGYTEADAIREAMRCLNCRKKPCVAGCPMGLDIPFLLSVYNDLRYAPVTNTALRIEALPESKKPDVCVGCGKCSKICPQKIDIPGAMQDFCELMEKIPAWEDVCRERAAAQPI